MEYHRPEVSHSEGVCMMCRFRNSDRLGLILGRFAKSAELAEACDQVVATENRWRRVASELVIDSVRGQRHEVVLGQLNHPIVLGQKVMQIFELAGGQDLEIQVAQDSCD